MKTTVSHKSPSTVKGLKQYSTSHPNPLKNIYRINGSNINLIPHGYRFSSEQFKVLNTYIIQHPILKLWDTV